MSYGIKSKVKEILVILLEEAVSSGSKRIDVKYEDVAITLECKLNLVTVCFGYMHDKGYIKIGGHESDGTRHITLLGDGIDFAEE